MITLGRAILALQPNAEFSYDNEDYSTLRWDTPEITIPSEEAIQAKQTELQAEYDALQYQRDQADSYPEIGDQLDMLFHAIDAGALDKNSEFYTTLKAVKDKYPKG